MKRSRDAARESLIGFRSRRQARGHRRTRSAHFARSQIARVFGAPLLMLAFCACGQTGGDAQPAISYFSLIDATTNAPISGYTPISDGSTLNLAALKGSALKIRAHTSQAASVQFRLGNETQPDSQLPFEFPAASAWSPNPGSHTLNATAYPQAAAGGAPGQSLNLSLNVIDDANAPPNTPPGQGNPSTLLARYYVWNFTTAWQRSTQAMVYRPRQFDLAPYKAWDVLELPGDIFRTYTRRDWLNLELNRPATLVVLWDGSRPASWLSDWHEGALVAGKRSFSKLFSAGRVTLGAIEGIENEPYTVLFSEADGKPSSPPKVPAGLASPTPNTSCPAWVHDQYLALGFDGRMYRTWHPQIDPVYWCYFEHAHGSDPALFAGASTVTFDYYADKGGRLEPHEGFKIFVVNSERYSMRFVVHLGSSDDGRICARIHTYDMAVADRRNGELLADLRLKSDFGITLAVDEGSVNYRLLSPGCPEMSQLPEATGGRISIPLAETNGYESWSPGFPNDVLGISNPPVLVTDNPITKLEVARNSDGSLREADGVLSLTGLADTGQAGERLWMSFPGADEGRGFAIRAVDAAATGVFYTDYRGQKVLEASDPLAVRQYLKPGLDFLFINGMMVFTQDAWQGTYEFTRDEILRSDMDLEQGLSVPN
jgi:hypothetical protein